MSYERAVKELAPCGIDCSRCVAYKEGEVVKLSYQLIEKLINFERMAKKMESFVPAFKDYDSFLNVLEHFSKGQCAGCRYGEAMNPACAAKDCHKDEQVDFCFQCNQYPCTNNNFNEDIYNKWKGNNDLMKEEGIEAFYIKQKEKTRY